MFKMSEERIATMDAVLTLNFDKNGKKNYIGGATFIEIYDITFDENNCAITQEFIIKFPVPL